MNHPDDHFCHRCDRVTRWQPTRRGSPRAKCAECGAVYPCRHRCDHLDCKTERARWRKEKTS